MGYAPDEHQKQILEQFTKQAEPFAQAPSHSTEESMKALLEAANVKPDDEVLDAACGPGIVACALARSARHVTGIDLVPAMLEQARKLQAEKRLSNLSWRIGNFDALPFPAESFSLVTTRYSFHHLLNPAAALAEMTRVCRLGGRVVVADVTPATGKAAAYDLLEQLRDPSHTHALTLDELTALGKGCDLQLQSTSAYKLDVAVESLLRDSFPPMGDAERFRAAVRGDIGKDDLSIDSYEHGGELRFRFPISVVVWIKQTGA